MAHSTYTALDVMSKEHGGRGGIVVNISSVMGVDHMYSIPAYTASKHGVIGLTRCFGVGFYLKKKHLLYKMFLVCRRIFIIKNME